MKELIVYFSRAGNNYVAGQIMDLPIGNTARLAGILQERSKVDLFEIKTLHAYSEDYQTCTQEALKEQQENIYPKLLAYGPDMQDYEVIYLCYPNWWGTCPMPVFGFLKEHNFGGKRIITLCTHEGSGFGQSVQDIKRVCPDALVEEGFAVQGSKVEEAHDSLERWLKYVLL